MHGLESWDGGWKTWVGDFRAVGDWRWGFVVIYAFLDHHCTGLSVVSSSVRLCKAIMLVWRVIVSHLLASDIMSRARRLRDSLGLLAHDVNPTAFQQVWHVPSVVFEADFPLLGCLPLLKGTHTDFSTFLYAAFPSTLIFQVLNCSIWQTVESVFQNARAIILQWASACHEP